MFDLNDMLTVICGSPSSVHCGGSNSCNIFASVSAVTAITSSV
jgi:hypothetical protein